MIEATIKQVEAGGDLSRVDTGWTWGQSLNSD